MRIYYPMMNADFVDEIILDIKAETRKAKRYLEEDKINNAYTILNKIDDHCRTIMDRVNNARETAEQETKSYNKELMENEM